MNFSFLIISPPTFEELAIEGYVDDEMIFDINQEKGIDKLEITFFSAEIINSKQLTVGQLFELIEKAAKHLLEIENLEYPTISDTVFEVRKENRETKILFQGSLCITISHNEVLFFKHISKKQFLVFNVYDFLKTLNQAQLISEQF